VFYKRAANGITLVVVAVNDLTLTSNSITLLTSCKSDLQSEFDISNMGEVHWLLGVEIKRDRHACTIMLSQKAYIDAICPWYHLQDARSATTPMEARAQLTDEREDEP